jgi:hypothetical protein
LIRDAGPKLAVHWAKRWVVFPFGGSTMPSSIDGVNITSASDPRCPVGSFFTITNTNVRAVIATVTKTFHRAGTPPSSISDTLPLAPGQSQGLGCDNDGLGQTTTFDLTGVQVLP